jgi:hypothetical protein
MEDRTSEEGMQQDIADIHHATFTSAVVESSQSDLINQSQRWLRGSPSTSGTTLSSKVPRAAIFFNDCISYENMLHEVRIIYTFL